MRVVFSRKGFDSAAGRCPSPLVEGCPLSLPIPTRMPSAMRYADLARGLGALVADLTRGRITPDQTCHLDPDIDAGALPVRPPGWRGCLGQVGAAQAHLRHQGVGPGDLFLFWGLFRPVTRTPADRFAFQGRAEHRLFGWLQVGEVLRPGAKGSAVLAAHPWLRDHPHARDGWTDGNTLYVAAERLGLGGRTPDLPGWGVFARGRRLSAPGGPPSTWQVPAWLDPTRGGTGLSCHGKPGRWDAAGGTLRSVARGQEFVADIGGRGDALDWLAALWAEDGR